MSGFDHFERRGRRTAAALMTAVALAGMAFSAGAQTLAVAERPLDAGKVVALYPGRAPGSETATWHEQVSEPPWGGGGGRLVRNVVQPTLTVFAPANPAAATKTAVIIAPGGGFRWLSIDSEGYDLARALAAQGVTAIVLKYRLDHTADAEPKFREDALAFLTSISQPAGANAPPSPFAAPMGSNLGVQDGIAAIRYVREHARELGVDPKRVGIVGFSAGGVVAANAAMQTSAAARPDFAGIIYAGGPTTPPWPGDTPVFLAVAADDPIASDAAISTFAGLRAQKKSAELHVYDKGGHGFGMRKQGLTSDKWYDEFTAWMAGRGLMALATP